MEKFLLFLAVWSGVVGCADSAGEGTLQKRFATFAESTQRKTGPEKRLYAACLAHAGTTKDSFAFMKRELSPQPKDVVLYYKYYQLAVIHHKDQSAEMLRNLIGTVTIKPFEAIAELDRGKWLARRERIDGIASLTKAVGYNPLSPEPYFELAKISNSADERNGYCASALLLCGVGSEMSARVLEFLEKAD